MGNQPNRKFAFMSFNSERATPEAVQTKARPTPANVDSHARRRHVHFNLPLLVGQ
jgi:hypothetical protein